MKKARPFVSFKAFHDSSPSSVICTYAGIKDKSKKTEKDQVPYHKCDSEENSSRMEYLVDLRLWNLCEQRELIDHALRSNDTSASDGLLQALRKEKRREEES